MAGSKKQDPSWRLYEIAVSQLVKTLEGPTVAHDKRIKGSISGRFRQVDVLAQGKFWGAEVTVLAECKRYSRKIGIGGVDELVGKSLDVGADHAMLYARAGFTLDARERARGARFPKISLIELDFGEPFPMSAPPTETVPRSAPLLDPDSIAYGPILEIETSFANIKQIDENFYRRFLADASSDSFQANRMHYEMLFLDRDR